MLNDTIGIKSHKKKCGEFYGTNNLVSLTTGLQGEKVEEEYPMN